MPREAGRSAWSAFPANMVEGVSVLQMGGRGNSIPSPALYSHMKVCVRVLCYHLCEDAFQIKTGGHESKMPITVKIIECFFIHVYNTLRSYSPPTAPVLTSQSPGSPNFTILFLFFSRIPWVQFILAMCSWVWDHTRGHGQPTRSHLPRTPVLFF